MAAYTTIDDPSAYFKVQLYTGDGNDPQAITFNDTDTTMTPNLLWLKSRDTTGAHFIVDSVRGATKWLRANVNNAEQDDDAVIVSLNSNGFSVGDDADSNANTEKFVAYGWKMGTTSGITTTGSNITPNGYSFSQTAGQSIIEYDGNGSDPGLLPHGLGAVPHYAFIKTHESTQYWMLQHHSIGNAKEFYLNITAAAGNSTTWNTTTPTTVNISLDPSAGNGVNYSSRGYVGYFFTSIQGYSKASSYIGNGNVDGPFIYTGFKPAFFLCKNSSSTTQWCLVDNKRGVNGAIGILFPEDTAAENATETGVEFLSNGIKIRTTGGFINESGSTMVYLAFAEAPFVNSNGVPCNAR